MLVAEAGEMIAKMASNAALCQINLSFCTSHLNEKAHLSINKLASVVKPLETNLTLWQSIYCFLMTKCAIPLRYVCALPRF